MEISGKALADVLDPKDKTKVLVKAGRADRRLRASARRRLDPVRQLDLWRLLVAGGQPHGTARQLGSVRPGPDAELGLRLAGQPAHHLQPRLVRRLRQAMGSEAHGDPLDRLGLGR
jgi:hypothetical protein